MLVDDVDDGSDPHEVLLRGILAQLRRESVIEGNAQRVQPKCGTGTLCPKTTKA